MPIPEFKKSIANVGFRPPNDTRLAVETLSTAELLQRAPAEHFQKLQRADFFRLIGVYEGQTLPMVDFSTYTAHAGDWLLVRPGQVFRYDFSSNWSGDLIVFRADLLSVRDRNLPSHEVDTARKVEDLTTLCTLGQSQHSWMMKSVHQLKHDGAISADVSLRNELLRLQLMGMLLRMSLWQSGAGQVDLTGAAEQTHYRRFRNLLDARFATLHQVQDYASALGMSEKTLSRVSIASEGVPAKTLINQRLVLEAKRLLAHTSMPVQMVGRELGFDDPTNFVKFFRKQMGMTPLSFRSKY